MQKFIFILIITLLLPILAQSRRNVQQLDSIHKESPANRYALPLLSVGLITTGSLLNMEHSGSRLRTDYKPSFNYKSDEVLRFIPVLALVGMKTLGVESRTPWQRMMVSHVFSAAIMGASVESSKRLTKRVRPDGSNDRSFPSGHTATAFMTATMFSKEYGYKSPWYSVGAYGVATSTAMLRRINDQHWLSDIMVGAGIGILSTELGYWLADIVYKDRNKGKRTASSFDNKSHNPSFAGVYAEYVLPSSVSEVINSQNIKSSYGIGVGMEGAKFFNPYLGIGGRMAIYSMQLKVNDSKQDRALDHVSLSAGPYFSYPLSAHLSAGANIRVGYGFYPKCELDDYPDLVLGGRSGWNKGAGLSLSYLNKYNMAFRVSAGYEQWTSALKGGDMEIHPWSVGMGMNWVF